MRGTIGYFAPEWTSGMAITAKDDVYSYGMMMFEIISGRRNLKQPNDGKVWLYPTWAANTVITKGQPLTALSVPQRISPSIGALPLLISGSAPIMIKRTIAMADQPGSNGDNSGNPNDYQQKLEEIY
ncbi:hypothetical protein Sjap_003131 [Stephania japonica]|uniref:Protein kinase domain-containing protein n=1 Tax=Stephania japonica TaxID=461633 RepID=A0AAP0PWS7_9MAGN